MRFPQLSYENYLQEKDRTRLDANKSFVTKNETITNVEIQPDTSESFISVFDIEDPTNREEEWYLDWAYETEGTKTVSVRITTDIDNSEESYSIEVVTEETDKLFSDDADLYPYEPQINRYLPLGKSSYKYAHRASQRKIIAYLDEHRIWKRDGSRYTKEDLIDIQDFKYWSIFQTLLLIFESSQINRDDIFQEKRQEYENDMLAARSRGALRLDNNGDGEIENQEILNMSTTRLVRR